MSRRLAALGAVAALAAALAPAVAQAAPKTYVPNKVGDHTPNGCTLKDCTLREAVIAANHHPGRDTIELRAKTYTLALPGTGEDAAKNGDLDITGPVKVVGKGAAKTTVDGGGSAVGEAAFDVFTHRGATLTGLTERNSVSSTGAAGIAVEKNATLRMSSAKVLDNVSSSTAGYPGIDGDFVHGTVVTGNNVVLRHVVVANNDATGSACCGGVTVHGSLSMSHTAVRANTSSGCCAGVTAADEAKSHAIFRDVRVIDNTGGNCCQGIETGNGDVTLRRVVISGNTGSASCCNGAELGGVANLRDVAVTNNDGPGDDEGLAFGPEQASVKRATISGNDASVGCCSGIDTTGPMTLTNVTVSGNTAAGESGGIFANGSTRLNNVTVTGNVADSNNGGGGDGGGIDVNSGQPVHIENSIVAGNSVGTTGGGPDCFGTLISRGHNLIGDTSGCTIASGGGNLLNVAPLLRPLADNGGFTETHALRRHSPAIDHGSPKPPGSGGTACAKTDQRGVKRPQGKHCDIGAYEKKRHHH